MAWDYYQEGRLVQAAGLTVLNLVESTQYRQSTRYIVRMSCCEKEIELTHAYIDRRIRERMGECRDCVLAKAQTSGAKAAASKAARKRAERRNMPRPTRATATLPPGVELPTWPVPPSVLAMPDAPWQDGMWNGA